MPAKSSKSESRVSPASSVSGMRRRARAGIVVLALTLIALSSCGAADAPTTAAPSQRQGGAEASRRGGIALKRIGSFDNPVYVAGAPGAPRLLFVVEQGG